ncbi:MAG: cysteine hydrolase family protein [Gammaproteobacteria bacterium]
MTAAATPAYIDAYTRQFSLSPRDTALVIVDLQYASGSRHHGLGKLLAAADKLDSAEYRFARIDNFVVPNSKRLAERFRSLGARVIYVTYGCELPDFGDAPVQLREWLIATNNTVGQREHEIVDEIKPLPGDLVLNKNTMGAFGSTGIDAHLRSMGIRNIVVTGVSTNNCVGMTAQEASDRQYGVVMVSDATGTCSDEMQEATLKTFRRLWGRVASTEEVMAEMEAHS